MRIKEICSLKTDDIDLSEDCLKITDSKSHSGIRELPIHSKLKKRVRELIDNSDDGYLLSGLTQNKYTDRSNAIGKRFGRLKASLGFPEMKVFHSIRKTVGTIFENNEVLENIVADIIGHSKPRMTYGKYSSGTNMKIKKEKIELLNYPWNKKVKTPLQISQEKEEVRKSRILDLKNQKTS
jgi:integrase